MNRAHALGFAVLVALAAPTQVALASGDAAPDELAAVMARDLRDPALLAAWGELTADRCVAPCVRAPSSRPAGLVAAYGAAGTAAALADLARALGLPLAPFTLGAPHGTPLASLTTLLAKITWHGDPRAAAAYARLAASAAPEIVAFAPPFATLRRLEETVVLSRDANAPALRLRYDVLPLPPLPTQRGSGALLVYSVLRPGRAVSQLLAFALLRDTDVDALFDPSLLGEGQPVRLRYDALVRELAPLRAPMGTRRALAEGGAVEIIINDNDWPPFFFGGHSGEPPGFAKEALAQCIPVSGHRARFTSVPIPRMQRDVELGALDVNVYSHAAGRDALVLYGTEPLFHNAYFPFMRRDAQVALRSLADFDPLRLGHLAGLAYSPAFHAYVESRAKEGRLDVTDSEAGNLRKLAAGRIDVFVSSVDTVRYYAHRLGLDAVVAMIDFPVKEAAYFPTLSRASTRLSEDGKRATLAAVDGCLRQLKRTGRYEALRRRYGLD